MLDYQRVHEQWPESLLVTVLVLVYFYLLGDEMPTIHWFSYLMFGPWDSGKVMVDFHHRNLGNLPAGSGEKVLWIFWDTNTFLCTWKWCSAQRVSIGMMMMMMMMMMMRMILWIWCPNLGSMKDEISAWKLPEDTAPVRSCMPKAQILGATSDLDHCGKLPPKKIVGERSPPTPGKGRDPTTELRFGPEMVGFIPWNSDKGGQRWKWWSKTISQIISPVKSTHFVGPKWVDLVFPRALDAGVIGIGSSSWPWDSW